MDLVLRLPPEKIVPLKKERGQAAPVFDLLNYQNLAQALSNHNSVVLSLSQIAELVAATTSTTEKPLAYWSREARSWR